MARGPEIPAWIRHVAISYQYQLQMPNPEICRKLNLQSKSLSNMLKRAKERSGNSDDLATLQAAVVVQPRSGRRRRAEPGSDLSLAVREGARKYPQKALLRAAKDEVRRLQDLGELDASIKTLGSQQIYQILQDPEHCRMDPKDQKKITTKRHYNHDRNGRNHIEATTTSNDPRIILQVTSEPSGGLG